ncbi:MAG: aspartate--tRNA ligase [Loktanella sp.]|nr:aspartate--tRNA ligase [Loktanella sp.]
MHAYRSHTCVDLTAANVGDTVRLSGWVHRRRDHGGVIFIDLRDHYGITQILCDPDSPVFAQVEKLRAEYCIRIDGIVKARAPDLVNKKLPTGEIEVYIRDMEVLGAVKGDLPLQVFGDQEYPEETRLTYRYLDLRREAMQRNITLRSDVVASMRKRMWDKGFREYQTPIITASSPEGARDGSDKPDLRNPIKMQVVSEHFAGSGFAIFANLLEQDGTQIRAIPAPKGGSRKFCDRMNKFAQEQGLPGMGYIFWRDQGDGMEAAGPLAKNIGPERTEAIRQQLGLGVGDAAFFLGGKPKDFEGVAGRARTVIGDELGLTDTERFAFAWIVDFPIYERDAETGDIDFEHNPFSMPQGGMEALDGKPEDVLGFQYDLACNGYELVSGAIRNHRPEIMFKAFSIAGYGEDEVRKRFGGMVNAFQYGAPPHGGCAAGIDRIVMLLADEANIREVIMFPMNQRAEDLMMGAPSEPQNDQLRELRLRVLPPES